MTVEQTIMMLVGQTLPMICRGQQICFEESLNKRMEDYEEKDRHLVQYHVEDANLVVRHESTLENRWWVKPRSFTWFDKFMLGYYDDSRWNQIFRMKRNTFLWFCTSLESDIKKADTSFCDAISVHVRVGCTFYKLFRGVDFLVISEKFGIDVSTAHRICMETCKAICCKFGDVIKFHVGEDIQRVISAFALVSKVPNVCGVLDCTHFEILQPTGPTGADYYDRKQRFSIILQAICDTNRRFLDINCGYPGSVHDSRVWKNSGIRQRMQACEIMQEPIITINFSKQVRPLILADKGYTCSPWLLVSFLDKIGQQQSVVEREFNKELMKARVFIEQAFGLLKRKFGVLEKKMKMKPIYVNIVAHSCCILHNLLIDICEADINAELEELESHKLAKHAEKVSRDANTSAAATVEGPLEESEFCILGEELRKSIAEYLVLNF